MCSKNYGITHLYSSRWSNNYQELPTLPQKKEALLEPVQEKNYSLSNFGGDIISYFSSISIKTIISICSILFRQLQMTTHSEKN